MKLNRKWLLVIALVLSMTMAISGTLAYLQDTDMDKNVMTLGSVKIKQHEYERVVENGAYKTETIDNQTSYVLQEYTQGKPLLPTTEIDANYRPINHGAGGWDDTTVRMSQVDSYGGMQVFTSENAVDKFVTVENTGRSDAYVRTFVAIEVGSGDADLIGSSYHNNWSKNNVGPITVDGNTYYVYEYVYLGASDGSRHVNGILPAGETSYPNLSQVYLKSVATNEDLEAIDGNGNGMLDILVLSQAIQADGFADANTALTAGFGAATAENVAKWFGGTKPEATEDGGIELKNDTTTVNKPLYQNVTADGPYTINGNGNTVTSVVSDASQFTWSGNGTIPDQSIVFSSEDGSKVTVNDLTIEGTISAVMAGNYVDSNSNWFNTELNNVNIVNAEVVSFSSGVSPALAVYGTATLNNCNIYGTTLSDLDTDPRWPAYDVVPVNYSDLTINNSKIGSIYMWNQAKVTVAAGSTVENIIVRGNMNTTKYGLTVEAGATVGAIDLSNITNKAKVNITIEEGANVGAIVANGTSYDSVAAWQAAQ